MRNKSERISSLAKDRVNSPGPGAYDANETVVKDKIPNYGFGNTERKDLVNNEEKLKPGPGNYNLKSNQNIKSFKIGQKINQSFKNNTPGPGNYNPNPNIVKTSVKGVKIPNKIINKSL